MSLLREDLLGYSGASNLGNKFSLEAKLLYKYLLLASLLVFWCVTFLVTCSLFYIFSSYVVLLFDFLSEKNCVLNMLKLMPFVFLFI